MISPPKLLATLIKKEGSDTSAKVLIAGSLSNGEDMATIREKVIEQILPPQINQAPVLAPIGNKTVKTENLLTFSVNAMDPDGDTLTYSVSDLPTNATFNSTIRLFTWIPTTFQVGTYNVTFGVTDGSLNDTESVNITVTAINQPPVLVPIGNKTIHAGNLQNFTVNATDPDDDILTYSSSDLPTNATFNSTAGLFALIPTTSQVGTCNIIFGVTDGSLNDTESVNITVTAVNHPPVLAPVGNKTVITENLLTFTVNATDPDGDTLTYSASNLPTNAIFSPTTRAFVWTPDFTQAGTYLVTFRVTDGLLSDTESVDITVTAVNRTPVISINHAPVLAPIGNKTVITENLLNFSVSATDPDDDTLTYSASSLPANASFNPATRSFAWTPATSQIGSFDVTFRVSDGSLSDTESVWITVIAVNHAPVLTPVGNKAVGVGNLLNFTINATDPDDNNLTYSASSLPSNATFNSTTRSFAWIPVASQVGTYNVTFGVSDGSLSDIQSVNIPVTSTESRKIFIKLQ